MDEDELQRRRGDLRQFATYLRRELARIGQIEVHACWDGEQGVGERPKARNSEQAAVGG